MNVLTLLNGLPPLDDTATDRKSLAFLFALLSYMRPSVILEAGTYQGHFAVGAGRVLPESRIHTFDPTDYGWNQRLAPNVRFHQQDFNYIPEPFTFAFIDSGPPFPDEPELTIRSRHWRFACDNITPGGIVACHDTNATDWCGVSTIFEESHIRLTGGRGLTLWQASEEKT